MAVIENRSDRFEKYHQNFELVLQFCCQTCDIFMDPSEIEDHIAGHAARTLNSHNNSSLPTHDTVNPSDNIASTPPTSPQPDSQLTSPTHSLSPPALLSQDTPIRETLSNFLLAADISPPTSSEPTSPSTTPVNDTTTSPRLSQESSLIADQVAQQLAIICNTSQPPELAARPPSPPPIETFDHLPRTGDLLSKRINSNLLPLLFEEPPDDINPPTPPVTTDNLHHDDPTTNPILEELNHDDDLDNTTPEFPSRPTTPIPPLSTDRDPDIQVDPDPDVENTPEFV